MLWLLCSAVLVAKGLAANSACCSGTCPFSPQPTCCLTTGTDTSGGNRPQVSCSVRNGLQQSWAHYDPIDGVNFLDYTYDNHFPEARFGLWTNKPAACAPIRNSFLCHHFAVEGGTRNVICPAALPNKCQRECCKFFSNCSLTTLVDATDTGNIRSYTARQYCSAFPTANCVGEPGWTTCAPPNEPCCCSSTTCNPPGGCCVTHRSPTTNGICRPAWENQLMSSANYDCIDGVSFLDSNVEDFKPDSRTGDWATKSAQCQATRASFMCRALATRDNNGKGCFIIADQKPCQRDCCEFFSQCGISRLFTQTTDQSAADFCSQFPKTNCVGTQGDAACVPFSPNSGNCTQGDTLCGSAPRQAQAAVLPAVLLASVLLAPLCRLLF